MAFTITVPQDASNNPMGINPLKMFLLELKSTGIFIPGVTVDKITFTKQGKAYAYEVAGAGQDIGLCDEIATVTAPTSVKHEITIDRAATFTFVGCYLTNFTEIWYDQALRQVALDAIRSQLEARLITTLDTNSTAYAAPVALTKNNILEELLNTQRAFKRTNNTMPTTVIADYDVEVFIKAGAIIAPNSNTSNLVANADSFSGLTIVYDNLTDRGVTDIFYMYRWDRVKSAFVNPDQRSVIPGMDEIPVDGMIIRKSETSRKIERETTMFMPYGMKVFNALSVTSYARI